MTKVREYTKMYLGFNCCKYLDNSRASEIKKTCKLLDYTHDGQMLVSTYTKPHSKTTYTILEENDEIIAVIEDY